MITTDVQKLEPGAVVELFELDASLIGATILRFHPYPEQGIITWQGNEYSPWAIKAEGFGRSGDTQQLSPTLSVGNIGVDGEGNPVVGIISAMCMAYDDFVGARLTRRRTLAKYLDAVNFTEGNPTADPDEHLQDEIWIVEEKTSETKNIIEFRLASALDFQGQQLPNNKIIANHCLALKKGGYRGYWCGYQGAMYDINDEPTTDPTKDTCSGMFSSCKVRFGEFQVVRFVGAPSADRVRGY